MGKMDEQKGNMEESHSFFSWEYFRRVWVFVRKKRWFDILAVVVLEFHCNMHSETPCVGLR